MKLIKVWKIGEVINHYSQTEKQVIRYIYQFRSSGTGKTFTI